MTHTALVRRQDRIGRWMTETLTKEKIEQLAPDQASLGAALKLMKPASWPMLSRATDASLLLA